MEGPKVSIRFTCFDCKFCTSERYYCQGDSGTDVYCDYPSLKDKKRIGDTVWNTPDFCPLKQQALEDKIKSLTPDPLGEKKK